MPPELIAVRGQVAPESPAPPKRSFAFWPVLLVLVGASWLVFVHFAPHVRPVAPPAPVAAPAPTPPPAPAVTEADLDDLAMHLQRANESLHAIQREVRQEDHSIDAVMPDIVWYRLWADRERLHAGQESGTGALRELNVGLQEIQIVQDLIREKTTKEKP